MKVLLSTIVSLVLAVGVWRSLPQKRIDQATPAWHDYLDGEPLSGSEVGKTLVRACGNCHSDQTDWPWYSHVAPVSWWIQSHVSKGREELNFSEWTSYSARQRRDKLDSICGVISTGRMPPWSYTTMHPQAKLTPKEKKTLCFWAATESGREK
jgi:hypothetical protein